MAPITLHKASWIGTRAFISMGVEIGENAVVGATASVYKDVEPWTVVGGNPAKFIKKEKSKVTKRFYEQSISVNSPFFDKTPF